MSTMGKAGKWFRNFLLGKKDHKEGEKEKVKCIVLSATPITTPPVPTTPKEKKRWSFRRSSAVTGGGSMDKRSAEGAGAITSATPVTTTNTPPAAVQALLDGKSEQIKHALAVEALTAAAADVAAATAADAAEVIIVTVAASGEATAFEEASAVKIQSVFRSYLARKALSALKGLVKLQALVRSHLVRKQATATLRCMQALVTAQARARAQRIRMAEEVNLSNLSRPSSAARRKSTARDNQIWNSYYDLDRGSEDSVKIVEMDLGVSKVSTRSRKSYSNNQDDHLSSPAPSARTDMSPRVCSSHFGEYPYNAAQNSPQCHSAMSRPDPSRVPFSFHRPEYAESLSYDYTLFPSYMANTESSRAKVRSQSAPKQRPDSYERQPSRRRPSMEGRNIPRSVKMQRSSSHVGTAVQGYQYPWSMKLDKSSASIKDSECGSASTMVTNTNYCKSLVSYDPQGRAY